MADIPPVPAYWRFVAHPTSVARARHAVTEALPRDLRGRLGSDLGLLTSELVTNAIRYGTRVQNEDFVELVLWLADEHYWVAVTDPGTGTGAPALAHPDADAESGRGLLLVDHLAAAWTVRARPMRGRSVIAGLAIRRER